MGRCSLYICDECMNEGTDPVSRIGCKAGLYTNDMKASTQCVGPGQIAQQADCLTSKTLSCWLYPFLVSIGQAQDLPQVTVGCSLK